MCGLLEAISVLISLNTDIAASFFLDDIPGVNIPGTRMRGVLETINSPQPITVFQQDFLRRNGYEALLLFALGELDMAAFRMRAQREQEDRLIASAAAKEREAVEQARREEITNRKNAAIFAEQTKRQERRRKLRELPDRFGLPFVEGADFKRVNRILRSVSDGQPIEKEELVWLGSSRSEYWTDELRKAHHQNMAKILSDEWQQTGDVWKAINACGHWRKADLPEEGLSITEAALVQPVKGDKAHSALLTTSGGALRDLRRLEAAARFGKEAHSLTPKDFRPCTLLGAIHIELGEHVTGANWYDMAEARGANRNMIDRELQSILKAAAPEERTQIRKALTAHDASRYGSL